MIDALKTALERVYTTIPPQILEATFQPYESDESLDSIIHKKVFLKRIRDDISLRGGKVFRFLLNNNWCKFTTSPSPYALGMAGSYSMYHIPPEEREHRDISCILEVRFPYSIGTGASNSLYSDNSVKGNTVGGLACAALQSQTFSKMVPSPQGIALPGNIIKLEPPQFNFIPWQVKVRLKYDDQFSGMDVSSVMPFAQLCEQAVKAHIYNNMIMQVESNFVFKGVELGVVKDIISKYEDANDKYDELLIQHGGAELFDSERLPGILRRMVPKK